MKQKITIALKRIQLTGDFNRWDKPGDNQDFAGSVYFDNLNYHGIVNHNGTVTLYRNGNKRLGDFKPKEPIIINDTPTVSQAFELMISEKFGIGSRINITKEGILIDCETIQSANTLLRAFRRHSVIVKANDYLNFSLFIPTNNPVKLLTA